MIQHANSSAHRSGEAKPTPPTGEGFSRTRWKDILIVLFLLVQAALPLRGFLQDKFETRGNFSWNMYSQMYRCEVYYFVIEPSGQVQPFNYRDSFLRPTRASTVLHADVLPKFHAYACDTLREQGRLGSLRGSVQCELNGREGRQLIVENGDLCTAENFGVWKP